MHKHDDQHSHTEKSDDAHQVYEPSRSAGVRVGHNDPHVEAPAREHHDVDRPIHRADQNRQRPQQSQILFHNVPDHAITPSRDARAKVVNIERSPIGSTSIRLTPSSQLRTRSPTESSVKCASTNVTTLPAAWTPSHPLGAGSETDASCSRVTRTCRNLSAKPLMDSSNSNLPSSRKPTCVAKFSISLNSCEEISTVISPACCTMLSMNSSRTSGSSPLK